MRDPPNDCLSHARVDATKVSVAETHVTATRIRCWFAGKRYAVALSAGAMLLDFEDLSRLR